MIEVSVLMKYSICNALRYSVTFFYMKVMNSSFGLLGLV